MAQPCPKREVLGVCVDDWPDCTSQGFACSNALLRGPGLQGCADCHAAERGKLECLIITSSRVKPRLASRFTLAQLT